MHKVAGKIPRFSTSLCREEHQHGSFYTVNNRTAIIAEIFICLSMQLSAMVSLVCSHLFN